MKKALIFDLDGTILDTLEDIHYHLNQALLAFDYKQLTIEEVSSIVGYGFYSLVKNAIKSEDQQLISKVLNFYLNSYEQSPNLYTKPYAGIVDLLNTLKEEYLLFVVSNKQDDSVQKLVHLHFKDVFIEAIGNKAPFKPKPDPDMVQYILGKYHIQQEDCIYIGDTEVDILTANHAGMPCIGCLWGFRSKEELLSYDVKYLVDHPSEIETICKNHFYNK
ncbi:MAG: HAD family hydrolase [Erysipelotrichaceae bacterium]|nr:HAD family hydrolase [Erysipelotrichaceae bacterium]